MPSLNFSRSLAPDTSAALRKAARGDAYSLVSLLAVATLRVMHGYAADKRRTLVLPCVDGTSRWASTDEINERTVAALAGFLRLLMVSPMQAADQLPSKGRSPMVLLDSLSLDVAGPERRADGPVLCLVDGESDNLRLELRHEPAHLRGEVVQDFLDCVVNALQSLRQAAHLPALQLSWLPPQRNADRWQAFVASVPRLNDLPPFLSTMADTVRRHAHQQAIIDDDGNSITFAALWENSRKMAHGLRELGIRAGDGVGVALDRSINAFTVLMAILRSGGHYVVVAADTPSERLQAILSIGRCRIIIAEDAAAASHLGRQHGMRAVYSAELCTHAIDTDLPLPAGDTMAYIMFTSGSTGVPKAIGINHDQLSSFLAHTQPLFPVRQGERSYQSSTITFDLHVADAWHPLQGGTTIVLGPYKGASIAEIAQSIRRHRVQAVGGLTTAVFHALVEYELEAFRDVRVVMFGGEALSLTHLRAFRERFPEHELLSVYGPTETTVIVTRYVVPRDPAELPTAPPLGTTMEDVALAILGVDGALVPDGAQGELIVMGDRVAFGYIDDPEQTAAQFKVDQGSGHRWYRTGDLVVRDDRGELLYLGRTDQQVKLHGIRVECGEVEGLLLAMLPVSACAVVPRTLPTGDVLLHAFVVAREPDIAESSLRKLCDERVPAHLVPARFHVVPDLPLNSNEKVDRNVLLSWCDNSRTAEVSEIPLAPTDPKALAVVDAFQVILNRRDIRVSDDFFELGGNSLLSMRLVAELAAKHALQLSYRDVFRRRTVAALAQAAQAISATATTQPARRERVAAPSDMADLWVLERQAQQSARASRFIVPMAFVVDSRLRAPQIQAALQQLAERHQALRVQLVEEAGGAIQVRVRERASVRLAEVQLPAEPDLRSQAIAAARHREATQPFALDLGEVMRAVLLIDAQALATPNSAILLLSWHHVAVDAWSVDLLRSDLEHLLQCAIEESVAQAPQAAPDLLTVIDALASDDAARRKAAQWWQSRFEGIRTNVSFPAARLRPLLQTHRGTRLSRQLEPAITQAASRFMASHGFSMLALIMAAVALELKKRSGETAFALGTAMSRRTRVDMGHLCGFFTATVAVPVRVAQVEDESVALCREIQNFLEAAPEAAAFGFSDLAAELGSQGMSHRHPVFDVTVLLRDEAAPEGDTLLQMLPAQYPVSKVDATFEYVRGAAGHRLELEYSLDLFTESDATALLDTISRQFVRLLASSGPVNPAGPVMPASARLWRTARETYGQVARYLTGKDQPGPSRLAIVADGTEWDVAAVFAAIDHDIDLLVLEPGEPSLHAPLPDLDVVLFNRRVPLAAPWPGARMISMASVERQARSLELDPQPVSLNETRHGVRVGASSGSPGVSHQELVRSVAPVADVLRELQGSGPCPTLYIHEELAWMQKLALRMAGAECGMPVSQVAGLPACAGPGDLFATTSGLIELALAAGFRLILAGDLPPLSSVPKSSRHRVAVCWGTEEHPIASASMLRGLPPHIDERLRVAGRIRADLTVAALNQHHRVAALDDGTLLWDGLRAQPRVAARMGMSRGEAESRLHAAGVPSLWSLRDDGAAWKVWLPAAMQQAALDVLPEDLAPTELHWLARDEWHEAAEDQQAFVNAPARRQSQAAVERQPELLALLLAAWRQFADDDQLQADDNFFEHGGTSLSAMRFAHVCERDYALRWPVTDLLAAPTMRALALRLERQANPRVDSPAETPSAAASNRTLTDMQMQVWAASILAEDPCVWNNCVWADVPTAISDESLAHAIVWLQRRHEALRTIHPVLAGKPVWRVLPASSISPLEVLDDISLDDARSSSAPDQAVALWRRSFDLAREPSFAARLLKSPRGRRVLVISVHHIVSDGWSYDVWRHELDEACLGKATQLPAPRQFGDYCEALNARSSDHARETARRFWRDMYVDFDGLTRPRRDAVDDGREPAAQALSYEVSEESLLALKQVASSLSTSVFPLLMCTLAVVLARDGDADDISLGYPVADRGDLGSAGIVGLLVRHSALRIKLNKDETFAKVATRVAALHAKSLACVAISLDEVGASLGRDRHAGGLGQVGLTWQTRAERTGSQAAARLLEFRELPADGRYGIWFFAQELDAGLRLSAQFQSSAYRPERVQRLLADFGALIGDVQNFAHSTLRPLLSDETLTT